ncbi:ubiquitin-like-specific protease 1D isoform X2 [Arachis ipaensis]|uniref:ubiquitin-like-specific protease 1D isoform X2 n=1 Tax=Arachis ipaensis TaxID=130454 RepID=UPI000A2B58D9|nr:ubiquitin-like-specific protease 1D isoform X2 [Arachis ipaensis]XP_029150663.1 ubiquitin-like-specific protease 1D isoform X2 [Arachis hypogaea]
MKTRARTRKVLAADNGDDQVGVVKQDTEVSPRCRIELVYSRRGKKSEPVIDVTRSVTNSLPCYLSDMTRKVQSKRKRKSDDEEELCKPREKLDSGLFGEYLEKIWRSFSEEKRRRSTYFDSLWFSLYRRASCKEKVLTWIKKAHIFSKAYVFVPIVCWGHWSLLIFCHFGESAQTNTRSRCMLLLDSLAMANPRRLEPEIRRFVLDIYQAADRPETKKIVSRIPLLIPKKNK